MKNFQKMQKVYCDKRGSPAGFSCSIKHVIKSCGVSNYFDQDSRLTCFRINLSVSSNKLILSNSPLD